MHQHEESHREAEVVTPVEDWLCHRLKRCQQPNLLTAFLILANNLTVLLSPLCTRIIGYS